MTTSQKPFDYIRHGPQILEFLNDTLPDILYRIVTDDPSAVPLVEGGASAFGDPEIQSDKASLKQVYIPDETNPSLFVEAVYNSVRVRAATNHFKQIADKFQIFPNPCLQPDTFGLYD